MGCIIHIPAGTVGPVVQDSALRGLGHQGQLRPRVQDSQGLPPQNPVGFRQSPEASGLSCVGSFV